jgi:dihydrolipoamide dehydrogenase
MKSNKVDTFRGTASLASPHTVSVDLHDGGQTELEAKHVILATGSVPAELPFLPFDGKRVVSSTEALAFDAVPERLIVVGAGAIGLELGSVWSRLGSDVTVVELMPQILPGFDARAATLLRRELKRQGLTIHTDTKIADADVGKSAVTLKGTDAKDKELQLEGEVVLVAVGRRPYTTGLGLETVGLSLGERGRVDVDDSYRTSLEGVYAIGDIINGPMLAHKAEDEGIAVAEIIANGHGEVNYDAIPGVVYTWPELASVGKTQEQLDEMGVSYRAGEFMFRPNGRALAMGATAGSVKILAEEDTDRVLGVHIVGPWASDLIAEATTVMEFAGSSEDIARTVHAHPTLTEVVKEAALAVDGRSIHAPRKR